MSANDKVKSVDTVSSGLICGARPNDSAHATGRFKMQCLDKDGKLIGSTSATDIKYLVNKVFVCVCVFGFVYIYVCMRLLLTLNIFQQVLSCVCVSFVCACVGWVCVCMCICVCVCVCMCV
jgi:hypothetical protein